MGADCDAYYAQRDALRGLCSIAFTAWVLVGIPLTALDDDLTALPRGTGFRQFFSPFQLHALGRGNCKVPAG